MPEHSTAYEMMKHQIIAMKNGQVHIATPLPINHEQAIAIFRGILHEQVNANYASNSGLTEDEAEMLHLLIDNVEHPDV